MEKIQLNKAIKQSQKVCLQGLLQSQTRKQWVHKMFLCVFFNSSYEGVPLNIIEKCPSPFLKTKNFKLLKYVQCRVFPQGCHLKLVNKSTCYIQRRLSASLGCTFIKYNVCSSLSRLLFCLVFQRKGLVSELNANNISLPSFHRLCYDTRHYSNLWCLSHSWEIITAKWVLPTQAETSAV